MSNYRVEVHYWIGTRQCVGYANTYRGAMRIASRNQNAYSPTFFDRHGRQVYDVGHGLGYWSEEEKRHVYVL